MKKLISLLLMCLWLGPHRVAADDVPAELENVRRALLIDLNDRMIGESSSIRTDRQMDLTQLEETLTSRCGLRVTRRDSDDAETEILKWVYETQSAQDTDRYYVLYLRGELAIHQNELKIGASGENPNSMLALAKLIQPFQKHPAKSHILVVLEDESSMPAKVLEAELQKTIQRANITQPKCALLVFPHDAKALGTARATRCLAESLSWSESTLTISAAGDIDLSLSRLYELLSARIPLKARVKLASNDAARPAEFLLPITPFRIGELMECLARQLSKQLTREGIERVGLLPFVVETSKPSHKEIPGEDCGTLCRICRSKLLGQLQAKSLGRFDVARDEDMRKALCECQIIPESVMTDLPNDHFPRLEDRIRGKDEVLSTALVWIRMKLEFPAKITFRVGLFSQKPNNFESIRESAVLTLQDAPAAGGSGGISFKPTQVAAKSTTSLVSAVSAPRAPSVNLHSPEGRKSNIEILKKHTLPVHPLSNDECPYRISLLVNGEPRPVQFTSDKSVAYTPLKPLDKIIIQVENRDLAPVFMRLTVDGQNTLPDRDGDSGHDSPQKFVDFRTARPWYIDPAPKVDQPRVCHIRGFVSQIKGEVADVNLFVVGPPTYLVEREEGFRHEAGMITAAFYQPVAQPIEQGGAQFLPMFKGPQEKLPVQIFQGREKPDSSPLIYYSLRYGIAPETTAIASPN